MTTTVASGTMKHQFGGLPGFHATPMITPLERAFVLCVGPPGEGKTTFIQSCPTGFTFNLDGSSTSPHVRGMVWPGIDRKGQLIDKNGRVELTWDKVKEVVRDIVELAKSGKPYPTPVFFDSLDALLPLIQDHLIRENNVEYWQDLDGRRMYGIAYDRIVRMFKDLLKVGVGVWAIGHVINAKIAIGEDKYAIRPELTIGEGLWKRMEWALEMICGIERVERNVTKRVKKGGSKKPDGSLRPEREVEEVVKEVKYILATDDSEYKELMKKRVALPGEIELPYEDGWNLVSSMHAAVAHHPTSD